MIMRTFPFNLQLFADGEEAPADGNQAPQETPADGEPAPISPNEPGGTILGNKAPQETPAETGGDSSPQETPAVHYDFSALVPEGMEYDEKAAGEFGNIAKECGLTQEQAGKIAAYGMEYMKSGVQAAQAERVNTVNKWAEDAKTALGADFDKTVAQAAVGIDKLETKIPGLRQMLNETGAGNRIEMIRFMAAVGNLVGEDGGHGVPGYGGEKSLYPNTNFSQYK